MSGLVKPAGSMIGDRRAAIVLISEQEQPRPHTDSIAKLHESRSRSSNIGFFFVFKTFGQWFGGVEDPRQTRSPSLHRSFPCSSIPDSWRSPVLISSARRGQETIAEHSHSTTIPACGDLRSTLENNAIDSKTISNTS